MRKTDPVCPDSNASPCRAAWTLTPRTTTRVAAHSVACAPRDHPLLRPHGIAGVGGFLAQRAFSGCSTGKQALF
jgi:hypothetical protein